MLPTNNRIIDVRSEHEFEKGTIPNSFNIPILNDDEYKLVGTDYKKHGQDSALRLGESLVTGEKKERLIDDWIKAIKKNKIEYIFCKRGGLRSKTAKEWLKEKSIDIKTLDGGYKSYRKGIVHQHEKVDNYNGNWIIVAGYTGSGKTLLIKDLDSSIDIESLAKHRGSTFGSLRESQPTQQNFENILTQSYLEKCNGSIILEAESRNIGRVTLPGKFYDKMRSSKYVFVEADIETRVNNIVEEYVLMPLQNGIERDNLLILYQAALNKINRRLGGDNYLIINDEMNKAFNAQGGSHELWIKLLLENYYDRLYKHKLDEISNQIIFSSDWSACKDYLKDMDAT